MHPFIKRETPNVWLQKKLRGNETYPKWKILQYGGSYKIEKEGYTFVYDEEGDTILCVARKPYKGLCFKITFDNDSGTIGVDISYSQGCADNKNLPKSSGTGGK